MYFHKLDFTKLFFFSFLCFSLSFSGIAQQQVVQKPGIEKAYKGTVETARYMIDTLMRSQNIPGMQVAVSIKGKTIWSEGFGYANLENKVPVWPSTKMRIGSVSKTLTSVALGKLVSEGKVDLDAPVQKYVPNFPKKKYEITTRQVAGHTAGIRHYKGTSEPESPEFLSSKPYKDVNESLDIFKDDSLLFKPGEKFHYSTFGWTIISAVVEGASKEDYLKYMRENVIEPLHMDATIADKVTPIILHRTSFYDKNEKGELVNAPYVDNSNKWAGGGYIGTAEDLLKFGNAMLYATYLDRETVDLLWKSQKTTDGEETHYGLGWFDGTSPQGNFWVGHSGGSVGGTTQFIVYPDSEVVIAITSNLSGVKYNNIQLQLADLFAEN